MKKWISTLAYAALLSPLSVFSAQQPFTGITGGINVGVIQSQAKINQVSSLTQPTTPPATTVINFGDPLKLSDFSGTVGLELGFASCFSPSITWGVELRANWNDLKANIDIDEVTSTTSPVNTISFHTSAKLNQQYSAIARLGYLLSNCSQLYVLIGPQWGNFKLNSYQNYNQVNGPAQSVYASLKDEHKNYKAGILVGLGLEQLLNPCTSIGLEYNYADYGRLNANRAQSTPITAIGGFAPGAIAGTNFGKNHTLHYMNNSMLLKLTYYYA